jgi:hypothetical protein
MCPPKHFSFQIGLVACRGRRWFGHYAETSILVNFLGIPGFQFN